MMKVIFPLLLSLLLFAGSTLYAVTQQKNEGCTQINIEELILQFRSSNDQLLDNFNEKLPLYRQDNLTLDEINMHRSQLAMVFESPVLSNPNQGYLKQLVSDELFDYNKNLYPFDRDKIREAVKNYIPDYEKYRCNYDKSYISNLSGQ